MSKNKKEVKESVQQIDHLLMASRAMGLHLNIEGATKLWLTFNALEENEDISFRDLTDIIDGVDQEFASAESEDRFEIFKKHFAERIGQAFTMAEKKQTYDA